MRSDDKTGELIDAIRLLAADTPVSCVRCRREAVMASDEWEEWVWLDGDSPGTILAVCPVCATQAERQAHEDRPMHRLARLARKLRLLAQDDAAWTTDRRADSTNRMREMIAEATQLLPDE